MVPAADCHFLRHCTKNSGRCELVRQDRDGCRNSKCAASSRHLERRKEFQMIITLSSLIQSIETPNFGGTETLLVSRTWTWQIHCPRS